MTAAQSNKDRWNLDLAMKVRDQLRTGKRRVTVYFEDVAGTMRDFRATAKSLGLSVLWLSDEAVEVSL